MGEFQDPKMEVRYCTIFQAIFCGDIPEMAIDIWITYSHSPT